MADREGMRGAGAMFRTAFPDRHNEADLLIGEDGLVVEYFTTNGTQCGEIFGVLDGRIAERQGRLGELGLLLQLGLVSLP